MRRAHLNISITIQRSNARVAQLSNFLIRPLKNASPVLKENFSIPQLGNALPAPQILNITELLKFAVPAMKQPENTIVKRNKNVSPASMDTSSTKIRENVNCAQAMPYSIGWLGHAFPARLDTM